ncbi:MAG: hydrogenase maturation protease [Pseudonocardia sp.]|nr:hydrogenase maturation protease [Pseudonocardia sp.]MBO0872796.1 hydrogenase maturation protease [Pseudonocardia sp.]
MTARANVLVAGIGNVFLSDDGFGVAAVTRLREVAHRLPPGVEVVDVGIRGMHLAYRLLDGYHTLVLVDTAQRGNPPGSLYLLEHDLDRPTHPDCDRLDAHRMDPASVLAMLDQLADGNGLDRPVQRVLVVGCEPASLDEGLELSEPVAAAVDRAVPALIDLCAELIDNDHEGNRDDDPVAVRSDPGGGGRLDHQLATRPTPLPRDP